MSEEAAGPDAPVRDEASAAPPRHRLSFRANPIRCVDCGAAVATIEAWLDEPCPAAGDATAADAESAPERAPGARQAEIPPRDDLDHGDAPTGAPHDLRRAIRDIRASAKDIDVLADALWRGVEAALPVGADFGSVGAVLRRCRELVAALDVQIRRASAILPTTGP